MKVSAYLGAHIFERCRIHQRETYEEDVGLGIRQRTQPVIVLLASRIPKSQVYRLAIDHNIGRVVVKDGRDVLPGKRICGVTNQQASLTNGTRKKKKTS